MKIVVTQKHIDKGVWNDNLKCAVALAINDVLVTHPYHRTRMAKVYSERVALLDSKFYFCRYVRLPFEAQSFLHREIIGEALTPFEFELDI